MKSTHLPWRFGPWGQRSNVINGSTALLRLPGSLQMDGLLLVSLCGGHVFTCRDFPGGALRAWFFWLILPAPLNSTFAATRKFVRKLTRVLPQQEGPDS